MSGGSVRTTTQCVPGPWLGLAGERMWLVADVDPDDAAVPELWSLVQAAAPVQTVLTALSALKVAGQHFAVLRLEGGHPELVIRGDAWARVAKESAVDDEAEEIRAAKGEMARPSIDRFSSISLHLEATETGPEQPCSGVVSIARLIVRATYPDGYEAAPVPVVDDVSDLLGHTRRPVQQRTQAVSIPAAWTEGMSPPGSTAAPAPSAPPAPAAAQEQSSGGGGMIDLCWLHGISLPAPEGPSAADIYLANHPPPTSYQPPSEFVIRDYSAPAAAPPPAGPPGPATGALPTPYDLQTGVTPTVPQPSPYPASQPIPYPAAVPSPYPVPQASPYQPSAPASADENPELTRTTQRASGTPVVTGPVVGAVFCFHRHPNPPSAARCRQPNCGQGVPPQPVQGISRPRLGVLRLSTGDVVPLDRNVIMGRAPGAPEGLGTAEPYRIQVASPDGSISRKHVEVQLKGWLVVVADLNSTNGTMIIPAGGVPEMLAPGGHRAIEHGTAVHLDSQIFFRFEVTE